MKIIERFFSCNIICEEDGTLSLFNKIKNKYIRGIEAYNFVKNFTDYKPEDFGLVQVYGYLFPVYKDLKTGEKVFLV